MKKTVFLLALSMSIGSLFTAQGALNGLSEQNEATSGSCGTSLTWNVSNTVLTISGSGRMDDFTKENAPWYAHNASIRSVKIGDKVTYIGAYAFYNLYLVSDFTIPDKVKEIGGYAFSLCQITDLSIGTGLEYIDPTAFQSTSRLDNVTWGTDVYREGLSPLSMPFYACAPRIKKFIVTDNVTSLPPHLCLNMSAMTTLTLSDDIETIGTQCFSYCGSLTSVTLPKFLNGVSKGMFEYCTALRSVNLSKITKIESLAFDSCVSLQTITLPATVTTIDFGAFRDCSSLRQITCLACPPPALNEYAFIGCANRWSDIQVVLSGDCDTAYYKADGWKHFFPSYVSPEKPLSGVFTVSATKKVIFSQGNLQYNAKEDLWRFAENQYDIIGEDNAYISATNDRWIDLFGWGTSGFQHKYPWMISTHEEDYTDGATGDIYNTYFDWGKYNAIANGGNQAGIWYTMPRDEWDYLLHTRTDADRLQGIATVAGMKGYVLLPDNWQLPDMMWFTPLATSFSVNTYSVSQWRTMENAGAVFLPVAGYRDVTSVEDLDQFAYYWTSSADQDDMVQASEVLFGVSGGYTTMLIDWAPSKILGRSVRLVSETYGQGVELVQKGPMGSTKVQRSCATACLLSVWVRKNITHKAC